MSYIQRMLNNASKTEAGDGLIVEANKATSYTFNEEILRNNIEKIERNLSDIKFRKGELELIITNAQEELRQVNVAISAYQLALGEMQANDISEKTFAKSLDTGIRHVHKDINA